MIYVYIQINKLVITSRVNDPWRASQPAWKMDPEGRAGCNNNAQAKPGLKTCVGSIGKWWKGQQIEGLQSQAGYKLRRASQARLANGSRKPCCVLHAPARERSQPGNKVWTISSLRVKPTFMLIKLRVLKKKRNGQRKRQQVKGLESQAGYTPRRAKNPKGTWLGKLRVQAESEETRAKIQKPGWLHAPAYEHNQPGNRV